MIRTCCSLCLALALGSAPAPPAQAQDGPLPYDVSVRVEFGAGAESPELVDMIRFYLQNEVDARRCMRSAVLLDEGQIPETELLARVRLSNLEEENEHLISIAQQVANPDPSAKQMYVARFEADVEIELIALSSRLLIRQAHFHSSISRQPRTLVEDAAEAVRVEAVEQIVRQARRELCKSPKKLDKLIRRALDPPAAD